MRGELPPLPPDHPALALRSILHEDGAADPKQIPQIPVEKWLSIYRSMLRIRVMDERLMGLQRQGRIGFYGEARGQEAAVIASVAPLAAEDWVVPALREAGAALHRGLPLDAYVAQIFGNVNDPAQGHQLPCHPGTRAAHYVTMSSCIATQLPHAVGMAWAAKLRGEKIVVMGFLGDGATSEEDFHVAMNFAAVFQTPVVIVCQNNQWAISTPSAVQTASKTMAVKALAYGMPSVRVDGNDVFAVYDAAARAIENARAGKGPTFIEALTYRVSAHSSSDDPTRYRDERITEEWKRRDPIARFRTWLIAQGHFSVAADEALRAELDADVRDAVAREEQVPAPPLHSLVENVFAEVPRFLDEEMAEIASLPRQKLGGVHQ